MLHFLGSGIDIDVLFVLENVSVCLYFWINTSSFFFIFSHLKNMNFISFYFVHLTLHNSFSFDISYIQCLVTYCILSRYPMTLYHKNVTALFCVYTFLERFNCNIMFLHKYFHYAFVAVPFTLFCLAFL